MGKLGKVCKKSGLTKRNPVPEWKPQMWSAEKKLARLRQRVRNMSMLPTMSKMAFMYVTKTGSLKIVGSKDLVEAIEVSNVAETLRPASKEEPSEELTVDARDVSLMIDFSEVSDAHILRKTLSQIVIEKGVKGCRSYWGQPERKPEWWGDAITFGSPSSTFVDTDGLRHRTLSTPNWRVLVTQWQQWVLKKIRSGWRAINLVDDKAAINQLTNVGPSPFEADNPTDVQEAINLIRAKVPYCRKHIGEIVEGKIFPFHFSPSWEIIMRRNISGVPPNMGTCGRGSIFWEIYGGLPQNLMLLVLASAIQHRDHYSKQLSILGETGGSLGERLGLPTTTEQSIEEVLEAAAGNMVDGSRPKYSEMASIRMSKSSSAVMGNCCNSQE